MYIKTQRRNDKERSLTNGHPNHRYIRIKAPCAIEAQPKLSMILDTKIKSSVLILSPAASSGCKIMNQFTENLRLNHQNIHN